VEFDNEFKVIYWSKQAEQIFGWPAKEILWKRIDEMKWVHEDDVERVAALSADMFAGHRTSNFHTNRNYRKDGSVITCEWYNSALINPAGELISVFSNVLDITERRQAEERITTSLKEKEILLQEIHHRVKNNLMIITSLLRLQSAKIDDKIFKELFFESEQRIKSMAIIHNQLYQTKDFARIDLNYYLRELCHYLFQTYQITPDIITLNLQIKDIILDLNFAIPLGLMLNELISNSLKHAFADEREKQITVSSKKEEKKNILIVADNGVGFPEAIDFTKAQSMDLQLVMAFVQQLHGTIDMKRDQGTVWTITFPVEK
jgi:PAS domain S-box-containing protein